MWTVSWSANAKLYDINADTGAASNPRSMNGNNMGDIAWDAAAEVLYAVTSLSGTPQEMSLYTVDPDTGAMTLVGSLGVFYLEGGLAVDPTTGKLYAMSRDKLYEVNKGTGAATLVGQATLPGTSQADVSGMAFDVQGNLFVLDNRSNTSATTLYQLDKSNAAVLSSVGVTPRLGLVGGFAIDHETGEHWVIDGNNTAGTSNLRSLNPNTGSLSTVGPSGLGSNGASGLAICEVPVTCIDPPPNMVSWWPFDETSGTVAEDTEAGMFGTNGSLKNGASWTPGLVAGALMLDGSNDYVQISNTWYLNPWQSDFTFDFWIRTSDTDHVSVIYDKRHRSGSSYYGYELFLYKGYLAMQLATGSWNNYVAGSTGATPADGFVADGAWHLVAITVDRDDPQGIRWYIDGVEVGSRANPTAHNSPIISNAAPRIGRTTVGSASYLSATIDELEIFARVLTPIEIADLYAAGSYGKCKP